MANGGTVFPSLGQSIPGVLDAPPGEKLWPALCCQSNGEECNVSGGIPLDCLGLQLILKF